MILLYVVTVGSFLESIKNVLVLFIQNSGKGESLNLNTIDFSQNYSSSRYFQRPDTSAITYIQKHNIDHNVFFLTVIDIVNVWV